MTKDEVRKTFTEGATAPGYRPGLTYADGYKAGLAAAQGLRPDVLELRTWKEGRLEPCTLPEFIQGLRHHADWADQYLRHRSDPAAHLGQRLNAAADALAALSAPQAQDTQSAPVVWRWRYKDSTGDWAYSEKYPKFVSFNIDVMDCEPLYAVPVERMWRPIETAPKNEMLLVGVFNSLGKWRSMFAQYRDDLPQHDDADDGSWYEESLEAELLFPVRPTHWMPLPAPPSLPRGK
jgi:hypothetical protein